MISFVHYDFVCCNCMNYYYCVMSWSVMILKFACRTVLFEFDFLLVFQLDFTLYLRNMNTVVVEMSFS